MSTELMHYAKGQKKKNAKYVDIVNGRYIYPEDLPRTQNRMRLKEERQDFYNIPKDYKKRTGIEVLGFRYDPLKDEAKAQIKNRWGNDRSSKQDVASANMVANEVARRGRNYVEARLGNYEEQERNATAKKQAEEARKAARTAQIKNAQERSKDYQPGSRGKNDRLPASNSSRRAQVANAKERSKNYEPADMSRRNNIANAVARTSSADAARAYTQGQNENIGTDKRIQNKAYATGKNISKEVNNILKEVAGNWEKFKQKTKKLSDQGKNLLASIFGWGK